MLPKKQDTVAPLTHAAAAVPCAAGPMGHILFLFLFLVHLDTVIDYANITYLGP